MEAPPRWTCPQHRAALEETQELLRCPEGHTFERREGIPRVVEGETYSDAFGLQWKRYRRTQLDSHTGTTLSRDRTRSVLGDELYAEFAGLDVLKVGCGAGRFTEVLLAQGARVTSVDLSTAVDANQENFPQDAQHRIAQADVLQLPFGPRQFDVVFCLGVVQHTPSPEATIAALYEHVRPGGWLALDHYRHRLRWWISSAPAFRAVLKRLPADRGLRLTDALVSALFPVHCALGPAGLPGKVLRRISPVQTYYHAFPELSDELQREWSFLDTHDVLTDWYKHFRTPRQIAECLARLGLVDRQVREAGNGIEARGRRPFTK